MGEVINLNAAQDPDVVLEEAKGEYEDVFIIGYDKEGYLDIRANIGFKKQDVLFAVEQFKMKLVRGDYDG